MKSLKSLILAGLTSALAVGCVTNNKYTAQDTSRLSNRTINALQTTEKEKEYILPANIPFEEKQELAKQYNRLPSYSGEVYIFKGNGSNELEVHAPLYTQSIGNTTFPLVKAIQNKMPSNATTYSFNLTSSNESTKRQLSDIAFSGFQNYATNPERTTARVTVNQKNSLGKKAKDEFSIKLSFGETNLTVNHKITDTRTPSLIAGAGGIGYLIAGIPGAVTIGGYQTVNSAIDYAKGGNLPSNTRVVEQTVNAGNLEQKIASTHNSIANAKGDILVFPHQYGTATISVNNPKGIIVGPNKEANLGPNEISFTTTRTGANTFFTLLRYAAGAGAVRVGNVLNEESDINGIFSTSSGGRTGAGAGGSSGSGSGGRTGGVGGGP